MNTPRPLHLCILLHMHQPFYIDPATVPVPNPDDPDGKDEADGAAPYALLPWVRLHGAAGYLDVASALLRHPGVHLTVNFVPSLLRQLAAVCDGARDRYLDVAERPATQLDTEDRVFLLSRFFSINWSRCVEPRPRYRALLDKRGRTVTEPELRRRAALFTPEELRDLTVLFHLSWLGFTARQGDPEIARLEAKGGGYSDDDLRVVIERGLAACRRVLPAYRELAARGQVELACSAYYHPIVPLLCDSDAARVAMPDVKLPARFAFPEDGHEQIRRGRAAFERHVGLPAGGMWPPEGSISPAAVHAYAQAGTAWLVSDEGNLWRSLGGHAQRQALFRAYRHEGVPLFFRDRELSDRIGFRYAQQDPQAAVQDLLSGVVHGPDPGSLSGGEVPVVTLALDGENAWQAYPEDGRHFLDALFSTLSSRPTVGAYEVRSATFRQHLQEHAPQPLLRLHAGSWIDSDFHIWIGDPVKNRAWELLRRARQTYAECAAACESRGANVPSRPPRAAQPEGGAQAQAQDAAQPGPAQAGQAAQASMQTPLSEAPPAPDEAALRRARELLLCAEGSDWFWWFGEPFHSSEDALYDGLFRGYLAAAYRALGRPVPPELLDPVDDRPGRAGGPDVQAPRRLIRPRIDGRRSSYYEWLGAGCYRVPTGAAMADRPDLLAVHFGYDREGLYLRVDPQSPALLREAELALDLSTPEGDGAEGPLGRGVRVLCEPEERDGWRLYEQVDGGRYREREGVSGPAAAHEILEVGVPWSALGARPGQGLQLVVRLFMNGQPVGRYPRDGAILLSAPDAAFEAAHWS